MSSQKFIFVTFFRQNKRPFTKILLLKQWHSPGNGFVMETKWQFLLCSQAESVRVEKTSQALECVWEDRDAIFNSDCSISLLRVFQHNHNHNKTDLKRKKKISIPADPSRKRERERERKWREWLIQVPSALRLGCGLRDAPSRWSELRLCDPHFQSTKVPRVTA